MNISLKPYQEDAVNSLVETAKGLLGKEGTRKICVFQAPTGSGKTIMTAKFIDEIIKELPENKLCFVWVSVGKGDLHLQSKHALKKFFDGAPRVSLVEEEFAGGRERIVRNEVVVVNWEKLRSKNRETGEWKNILMKAGDKINFRAVLAKTREERKIILIIDESHIGATAERTNELRDEIDADIILEMSATPKLMPTPLELQCKMAGFYCVIPQHVIDAGVIKKELIINEHIDEITGDEADSQEVVLEAAYRKRLELKKLFIAEGSEINPLVLIQVPTAEAGKDKIQAVRQFLGAKHITEDNRKLAIWLAEQKSETLDWISKPNNEVEFLIFKQAIDTGWDCPRAHILVKFRESHSETFEIQTVGRILRMPELRHYANEALNIGYIYTNVQSIIVKKEEYNPNIIKHLRAVRKDCYTDLQLPSYYKSRVDYGDITSSFNDVFNKIACDKFGITSQEYFERNRRKLEEKGVVTDLKKYQQEIIRDAKIEGQDFDQLKGPITPEMTANLNIAGNDLQALFDQIIKAHLGSFKNIKRSVPKVRATIYLWFQKYLGSKEWDDAAMIVQKIFVHNGNRPVFEGILTKAVEHYALVRKEEIDARSRENERYYDFDITKDAYYNQHTDEKVASYKKCVYEPCYLPTNRNDPERLFEKFLEDRENAKNVIWWWKNGESKDDYFGIRYEHPQGEVHTFYPDFLIQLSSGTIGIIEVKHSDDREGNGPTKAKAEALHAYIAEQNKKGHKLFGGIAIHNNGVWRINNKPIYDWEKRLRKDWRDWDILELK